MDMKQHDTPLLDALIRHVETHDSYFHVPGHKQGRFFDKGGRPYFEEILKLDLTEVGELDDLHEPTGVILEAQRLAAHAFGATQTWFLVGGSTVGNLALVKTVCAPGDGIVVQRNSHKSVFNGCVLAGARPVYLQPARDAATGVYAGVSAEQLRGTLKRHPNVKAVFLTNPNYYGMAQPVDELAAVCERFGVPLIVDEAHGAHFSVHPQLPRSAIVSGATAVVQSAHKMLPAMTMTAMVHAHGTSAFREKLQLVLSQLQSSSPSYPLLASLDLTRKYYATQARCDVEKSLPVVKWLRDEINGRGEWKALSPDDPYKLILQRPGWSGYEIAAGLRSEGVPLELSDSANGLAVLPLGLGVRECDVLLQAVDRWSDKARVPKGSTWDVPPLDLPDVSVDLPLSQVVQQDGEWCPLEHAAGRIAKRAVLPYPPGIPVVLPGETFSRRVVEYIQFLLSYGARFQGVKVTPSNTYVEVVK